MDRRADMEESGDLRSDSDAVAPGLSGSSPPRSSREDCIAQRPEHVAYRPGQSSVTQQSVRLSRDAFFIGTCITLQRCGRSDCHSCRLAAEVSAGFSFNPNNHEEDDTGDDLDGVLDANDMSLDDLVERALACEEYKVKSRQMPGGENATHCDYGNPDT
mmetsp:Transcript_89690/g.231508  ORF Transcript_89690/g.231508 Transcript_89690/m.231508 type:complete len:159 (+) Transcript_89690:107-583(+)